MINTGLMVCNQDGFIQIDSKFRNTALVKSGFMKGAGEQIVRHPAPVMPMVFIQCSQGFWGGKAAIIGGTFAYNYYAYGDSTYYIFDMTEATGSAGLQVFNEKGECVFDATRYYLRVAKNVLLIASSEPNRYITLDKNKSYAASASGLARSSFTLEDPFDQRRWEQTTHTTLIGCTQGGYNLLHKTSYLEGTRDQDMPEDIVFDNLVIIADVTDLPTNF